MYNNERTSLGILFVSFLVPSRPHARRWPELLACMTGSIVGNYWHDNYRCYTPRIDAQILCLWATLSNIISSPLAVGATTQVCDSRRNRSITEDGAAVRFPCTANRGSLV